VNCYDCLTRGIATPAVAICQSCGAALCGGCVRRETQDSTSPATPGNPSHHATRRLVCAGCDMALRAVA